MKKTSRAFAALVVAALLPLAAAAQTSDRPEYGLKEKVAATGSSIRRESVKGDVPVNLPYEKLSAADKRALHARWESIPEGDEPPFPVDGLKVLFEPIDKIQRRLGERGELFVVGSVEPDGSVGSVSVIAAPSKKHSDFAAQLLMLTRFKPAKCAGAPCRTDFPLQVRLDGAGIVR